MPTREESLGVAGCCTVCIAMLLVAILGWPPYEFFTGLKWAVVATCGFSAWHCWRISKALAPVCLLLVAVAAIHALGKMQREQWELPNWSAVATFALVLTIVAFERWKAWNGPTRTKAGRFALALAVVAGIAVAIVFGAPAISASQAPSAPSPPAPVASRPWKVLTYSSDGVVVEITDKDGKPHKVEFQQMPTEAVIDSVVENRDY